MPSNVAKRPEKTVHISQVILPKVAMFVVSSAGHFLNSRSIGSEVAAHYRLPHGVDPLVARAPQWIRSAFQQQFDHFRARAEASCVASLVATVREACARMVVPLPRSK